MESKGERGVKHWTLRILICLILGAITTVAVAWGCASSLEEPDWDSGTWSQPPFSEEHFVEVTVCQVRKPCASVVGVWRYRAFLSAAPRPTAAFDSGILPSWLGEFAPSAEFVREEIDEEARWGEAIGWPAFAMSQRGNARFTATRYTAQFLPVDRQPVPTNILFPGFVIDTLFYGAIWGGLWFGFAGGKRFIRSKRGRCPRCGYDLRGITQVGYSECGWQREESAA
jgi:hypothetical protein